MAGRLRPRCWPPRMCAARMLVQDRIDAICAFSWGKSMMQWPNVPKTGEWGPSAGLWSVHRHESATRISTLGFVACGW
jgi:hypothetical protein